MIKKILVYGIAFGSASSALVLIHFYNSLYKNASAASMLSVFGQIAIVIFAVIMCVRSVRISFPDKTSLGKMLITGLFVAALIGAFSVAAYSWVLKSRPEVISDYKNILLRAYEAKKATLPATQTMKPFNVEDIISVSGFARFQMSLYVSIGMMVSCIMGLTAMYKKN